jgi:hypothetical protein
MPKCNTDIRVYDVSAEKWISGIIPNNIIRSRFRRAVTEGIGEFEFDWDMPTCNIQEDDIVVLNLGQRNGWCLRWFVGQVDKSIETGSKEHRRFNIVGREMSKILMDKPGPEGAVTGTQTDVIKQIVSPLVNNSPATSRVSGEPIFINETGYWNDLCVDTVISGTWSAFKGPFTPLTYGVDYQFDLSTNPPSGRVRAITGGSVSNGEHIYINYQTNRNLPFGYLDSGIRKYEIYDTGIATNPETIVINAAGVGMWGAVSEACGGTTTAYDFYLSPSMELVTLAAGGGVTYETSIATMDAIDVSKDTRYILNDTKVMNRADSAAMPADGDEWTEGVSLGSWSAEASLHGVFDCVTFADNSSQADVGGGYFRSSYSITPSVIAEASNVKVGSYYIKTVTASDVRCMISKISFSPPIDISSPAYYSKLTFYAYANPTLTGIIELRQTDSKKYYYTFGPGTTNFGDPTTKLSGWDSINMPTFASISSIAFKVFSTASSGMETGLDGFAFGEAGMMAQASDSASQTLYGLRRTNGIIAYPVIDNTITTIEEAQQKAASIIAKYKDPIDILEKIHLPFGNILLIPGGNLKVETNTAGQYYQTVRIQTVEHQIYESTPTTLVECESSPASGIEAYIEELDAEIRKLEMRIGTG